jgi:hypothetical protein
MKHHYVPVFYQKHFAAPDGLLWVYDRLLKTCKQLHPLSICCRHDLYAVKMPGSAFEQVVETGFLRHIDGSASFALKKLPGVLAAPGPELLGEIIYFAALQCTRVPANKQMISMIHEAGANDIMEVAFANVERATAMMNKYAADKGKELKVTPESMVEAVKSGSIKAVATEMPFIQSVVNHTEFIEKVFSELEIKILISPPQVGFVLSDNPVTMVPPPGMTVAGFKSPGTFVFMPLTRSLCLRLGQPGSGTGPRNVDREAVRFINENTAINSDRFVMGPSRVQIESVIRRSRSTDVNKSERWITNKIPDGKRGILRQLVAQPRQVHYLEL